MTEAWKSAPLTSDADVNLKISYSHPQADAERAKVIAAMRRYLRLWPSVDKFRPALRTLRRANQPIRS